MLAIVTPDKKYINNLLDKLIYTKKESPVKTGVYKCKYSEHDFVIMETGYGKVNIGSSLRYICEKYNIGAILCIGTCGSINDLNDIFTAVVPNSCLQFDVDFILNGYIPGQIPNISKAVYNTNNDINNLLVTVCNKCDINYSNNIIASSDMFVSNYSLANSIRMEYNACAVDCESGSVGEYAYVNNIPYSCIKVISNYANNNGIKQYNLYDLDSSIITQRIVYKFLNEFYKE